jgi:hypothetical protein
MSKRSRSDEVTAVKPPPPQYLRTMSFAGFWLNGKRNLEDSRPRSDLQEPS